MSEESFRKWLLILGAVSASGMLILAVVFTLGILLIGNRIADNGRYQQYDQQKDALVRGNSSTSGPPQIFDTRLGIVQKVIIGEP